MTTKRPSSIDIRVGQSIRAHRLIAGLSQSDLADKLGVSFQQVQKYEKGVNRVGAGRLLEIARVFNIQINALFEAHAETFADGAVAGRAPVHLISDKSALKLLAAYADITDRGIRRGVSQMVDVIARASRKAKKKSAHRAA
jgi:transcriptional regulator with XRE-family HTH domain